MQNVKHLHGDLKANADDIKTTIIILKTWNEINVKKFK